jgi:hypothetical protein
MEPCEILGSRLPRQAAFGPPNDRPFFPGNNPRSEAARSEETIVALRHARDSRPLIA